MLQKTTTFRDRPEVKFGHTAELLVAQELQRRGWYVNATYDFSGSEGDKAPKMMGLHDGYVLPDLDVARDSHRKWVEVKAKTQATFTKITNRLEHGINKSHWDSYRKIEEVTGTEAWLAIYEEDTGDVLVQRIRVLASVDGGPRVSQMKKHGRENGLMVYFPRTGFRVLCNIKGE
jgi:hypothetical protein